MTVDVGRGERMISNTFKTKPWLAMMNLHLLQNKTIISRPRTCAALSWRPAYGNKM